MFNRVIAIFLISCLAYILSITSTGCANMVPPVGGPRDSTAPKITKVIPNNKSLNVKTKTITMDFDEYIDLEDQYNRIVISPLPNIQPEINKKLKTITIKLKDTLMENTTYSIAINGAVKDVNEGNKLNDFVYIFSTGNTIDSNTISGNVKLAETGELDSTLVVILHNSMLDSAVAKERPKYATKLDGKGNFIFKNLPNKKFNIFALTDEGGQKKYTSPVQLFAYSNEIVDASKNTANIQLLAYAEEKEKPKPPTVKPSTDSKIKIGNSLQGNQHDVLKDFVIYANKKLNNIDTNKIFLTDTTYTKRWPKKITIDSIGKNITIQTNWQFGQPYRLVLPNDFATDEKNNPLPKSDTVKFVTKEKKEYGNVIIRFEALTIANNPVLQIVQNGAIVNSYPLKAFKLNIPIMNAGEYELRLLYDDNKNGKWDAGSYFVNRRQPEVVVSITKKLNVKADWDNEMDIDQKL